MFKSKINILIENTSYSLLIYFLLKKDWKNTVFILNNESIHIKLLSKLKKYKLYIYKKYNIQRNTFKYFFEHFKLYLFLYKMCFRKNNIIFYGNDNLDYFIFFKNKIILLEDGLTNYKLQKLKLKSMIKNFLLFKPLFFRSYGCSKYVKKIYLTGLAPIPEEIKDKVEIINLKELWDKKSDEEKEEILNIFGFDKNIVNSIKNRKYILYTQPLSEDEVLLENEKIELYSKILEKYDKNCIVLKKHPREKTDYKKIFIDIEVMDQVFPAELLTLLDIHFEKAITIFSTAALTDSKVKVDFYGTEIHPKLFKKFGSQDTIMKRNAFFDEEEKKQ